MTMHLAIIDDDALFRQSLHAVLRALDANVRIEEFACIPSRHCIPSDFAAQLVLLDYHIPDTEFARNLSDTRARFPAAKVTVLSADDNPHHILAVLEQGADGFIPKSSNSAMLIAALNLVLLGQTYLPVQVMSLAPSTTRHLQRQFARLSTAQQRVLLDVVAGKSNKLIAFEQKLAIGTVKSHLSAAYTILGFNSRAEAVIALSTLQPTALSHNELWPNAQRMARESRNSKR